MNPILDLHQRFRRHCSIECGYSISYIRSMKQSIQTFSKWMEVENMSDMNLETIRHFFEIGREERQWSVSSYHNHHKYLNKFLQWCIENRHVEKNPMSEIKKPKKQKSLPRRLSEEEGERILHTSLSLGWRYEFEAERNYAMISTLLFTGLRSDELLSLKVSSINLRGGTVLVEKGKGGKDRQIPLYKKLERVLKRYMEARTRAGKTSEYLFPAVQSNMRLQYRDLRLICKKISQITGIKFTPHQLRHTFASVCVDKEMPLAQLQSILGHSDIKSTMIYTQVSPKATANVFNKLDLF